VDGGKGFPRSGSLFVISIAYGNESGVTVLEKNNIMLAVSSPEI
jgi:hypothetical protein